MATVNIYVDPDASGGGTGVDWTNAYTALETAITARAEDLTTSQDIHIYHCRSLSGTADTTAVEVDGYTTSAAYYVEIRCDLDDRHSGSWNATRYRLSVANASALDIECEHCRIIGLQIEVTAATANGQCPIEISDIGAASSQEYHFEHLLIRTHTNVSYWTQGIYLYNANIDGPCYVKNCVVHHRGSSGSSDYCLSTSDSSSAIVYLNNNTFIRDVTTQECIRLGATPVNLVYNNIFTGQGATTSAIESATATVEDYNSTSGDEIKSGSTGANSRTLQTFTFRAPGSWDYRIDAGDAGARTYGVDLYNDPILPVTTDVEKNPRDADAEPYDIGASQGSEIRYVDPDAGGTEDGETWVNAYTSLFDWEVNEDIDLTVQKRLSIALCRASSGTADTTAVTLDGWTTTAVYYVVIKAATGDQAVKTSYDTSRYRLEMSLADAGIITILEDYVNIIGLQIYNTNTTNSLAGCITQNTGTGVVNISGCRLISGNNGYGIYTQLATVNVWNTIIYSPLGSAPGSEQEGYFIGGGVANLYNCIICNCDDGLEVSSGTMGAYNCAVFNNDVDFVALTVVDYCASDDNTGTNNVVEDSADTWWTSDFVAASTGNFTLIETSSLVDGGTDDPGTGLYSDDIDGDIRGGTDAWSVGADQAIYKLRYVDPDAVGTGTGKSWTNAYVSLFAWEAAQIKNLVNSGLISRVLCQSSSGTADTVAVVVTGWTTSADYYVLIEVPQAYRHDGKRDATAYRMEVNTGFVYCLDIETAFTKIIGIQAKSLHANGYGAFWADNDDIIFKYCIAYDTYGDGFGDNQERNTFINCAALNPAVDGFYKGASGGAGEANAMFLLNCVSMGAGANGINVSGFRHITAKNCYFGGSTTNDINLQANGVVNLTTTYTEDGSEGTTTAAYSTSAGCYFVNVTATSEDPHIGSASSLKDNGTDLGADSYWYGAEDDIDGDDRGATWDIGADEYVGVATYGLSGVTRNNAGVILGSCDVYLMKDGLDDTFSFEGHTTSHATTGVYTFSDVGDTLAQYLVIAWKDDSPHVFDATDYVLQPVEE